jgi:N-acetylated-alpha-linked acidic dipeptidase
MKHLSILQKKVPLFLLLILVNLVLLSSLQAPSNSEKIKFLGYKNFIDKTISPESINRYLKYLTAEPHAASSARNNELANFILNEWKTYGLDEVRLAQYEVLLSFPKEIIVEMLSPKKYQLTLKEAGYKEDPDTLRPDVGIPYNAYSGSGDITASLVYANSGNPQDYDLLEKNGIRLKGKIALVRYSSPYSYRGFKAYTAERRGLAALLIYSDPKEDGFSRGPVFPHGPWGPLSHIQRGGIPYDFIYPGDPLTPGWASKPGCKRISPEEALSLPKIISVPISAQDALPLLEAMEGEKAPDDWKGALPVTYRLGGSKLQIHIKIEMENPIKKITNVKQEKQDLSQNDLYILPIGMQKNSL